MSKSKLKTVLTDDKNNKGSKVNTSIDKTKLNTSVDKKKLN